MALGAAPRNYKARYPLDPYGQEMSANARIWSIYLDEAAILMPICWQSGGIPLMSCLFLCVPGFHSNLVSKKSKHHRRLVSSLQY